MLLAPSPAVTADARDVDQRRYIYYLHGKIVEDAGPRGVSPRFGAYDYPGIIAALRRGGLTVPPTHITVAGASKGAVIASLVSTRLADRPVRYVLMANCNDWLIRTHQPRLSGAVLSIYEASDDVGGSCRPLVRRSPAVTQFREVRLDTGLGHGIVYRPLPAWVRPTIAWAKR